MFKFGSRQKEVNWKEFFGESVPSRKAQLLDECNKYDVTIYVDDVTENTSNNVLRGVASEAELERRLNNKKVVNQSKWSNLIAISAFIIALLSLAVTVYDKVP